MINATSVSESLSVRGFSHRSCTVLSIHEFRRHQLEDDIRSTIPLIIPVTVTCRHRHYDADARTEKGPLLSKDIVGAAQLWLAWHWWSLTIP